TIKGDELHLGFHEASAIEMQFLALSKPGAILYRHRDFAIADIQRLCETLTAYREDVRGYFADCDVKDAAFCVSHSFLNGDRVEYRSPLVIGVAMDRTEICDAVSMPVPLD